jgi:hypothetical protein
MVKSTQTPTKIRKIRRGNDNRSVQHITNVFKDQIGLSEEETGETDGSDESDATETPPGQEIPENEDVKLDVGESGDLNGADKGENPLEVSQNSEKVSISDLSKDREDREDTELEENEQSKTDDEGETPPTTFVRRFRVARSFYEGQVALRELSNFGMN